MRKLTLALAVVAGFAVASLSTTEARAQGFHFRSGPIHIDVGNVHHGRHGYYGHRSYGYGNYGRSNYGHQIHGYYGRGHYIGNRTIHYQWHPSSFQRHGNHFDYVPGHFDVYHGGGHHYGHRRHYGYGRSRHRH